MPTIPFKNIISTAVPLDIDNIDTDQIIPARFLKAVSRDNFGENLFADWRYRGDSIKNPDFILNNQKHSGQILLTGNNFGCGSSREHAAWALYDYGFRVVVSSHFADIFRNNALNNGLLPIQLPKEIVQEFIRVAKNDPDTKFSVNLNAQTFGLRDSGQIVNFQINAFKKECLIKGYDSVDYLLSLRNKIESYELAHS